MSQPNGLLYESFGVFCPTKNLDCLHQLRSEDMLINWSKPLYINFVHCEIAKELFNLYEDTGKIEQVLGDVWACKELKYQDEHDEEDDDDDDNSTDGKVLQLCAEHAESIHELYPANDMECHELFLRLIKLLPAAGVFVDGKLAAWMIQSYYGAMFSMQTKPEYRRKGYGTRLARYLTRVVVDRGYTPFVVIRPENEASQSLYKKLGFCKLYQTVRATFIPYGYNECIDNSITCFVDAVRNIKIDNKIVDEFENDNIEQDDTKENNKNCIIKCIENIDHQHIDDKKIICDEDNDVTCDDAQVPDSGGDD
ncbi:uncharacterized protein LOC122855495 isoform X2 [Aphidius gifuensis]|uniref:uncharacterized protein LOC122855495 isoform X2 n=1 Tax=Aphidius gifuensis TaxID=684658 RepID=UPI001CDB7A56|nr:uncharacterized protein LOC122855495 isoform X2 [Aphidius gifuensis]